MSEATEAMVAPVPHLPSRKLSMWLFLGSEVLFFSSLIFTYIIARATSPNWPDYHSQISHVLAVPLTALNTFILICSSVSVVLALEAIKHGNQRSLVRWLAVTFVLGCFFLSVQGFEYHKLFGEGLTPFGLPLVMKGRDAMFGTTFYSMTGFHGMHVLVGVLTLGIVLLKAIRGHYTAANHDGVELFGLYWHFVDLVWIILFTIVYLI